MKNPRSEDENIVKDIRKLFRLEKKTKAIIKYIKIIIEYL